MHVDLDYCLFVFVQQKSIGQPLLMGDCDNWFIVCAFI